jgi:hypothetical protein
MSKSNSSQKLARRNQSITVRLFRLLFNLMIKAVYSSETSVDFYQTTLPGVAL